MKPKDALNIQIRLPVIILLSWLSIIAFDFLLHAGLLARFYLQPNPFLLPPDEAFRLIPLGYLSFLLLAILLTWLMIKLGIEGWRRGFIFCLKLGGLIWGIFVLGLLSISTAEITLLIGWLFGHTVESAIAGAVIGSGLEGERVSHLFAKVLAFTILIVILTIILQNVGLTPAVNI